MNTHQFGYVITLSDYDLHELRHERRAVEHGNVLIIPRGYNEQVPEADAIISMSDDAISKVERNKPVTYGVMNIAGSCQEVFVRRGSVSDHLGEDASWHHRMK